MKTKIDLFSLFDLVSFMEGEQKEKRNKRVCWEGIDDVETEND